MGQGVIAREDIAVEDITKNIRDSYEKLINKIDETNTALNKNVEAFAKVATQANTKTKRGLDELTIATQQSKKAVDQANNSDKVKIDTSNKLQKVRLEEIRLEKAREKAIDDYTRKEEINAKKQAKAKQDVINASIKSKKATLDENNAYKQLTKQVNLAQARFKRLAVQHGINSKEAKKAERTFRSLDNQLRRVNNAANDGRRDVGRYGLALKGMKGGVTSLLGSLGLMGGAFAIFNGLRSGLGVIVEYENALASFRTIVSDLSDKEFSKFEGAVTDVATKTKRSSIDIASSFETIAGLNAEFAKTTEGISAVSEAVSTLAKASNGELQPTAENLVGIMNQFDLSADQANRTINVLAAGQAVGAASIQQSSEAYKNFGSVAAGANINLEKSQALIQTIGKFSIFGAEAGTKLRGVTLKLQAANLGYASGQFNINDALKEYNEKLAKKTTAQDKDALSAEVFGAENVTVGKILSNNIPLIEKFEKGVTGTSEAQKAAEINSNTLSDRWVELKNSVTNLITQNSSLGGGMDMLKSSMKFLSDNIGTVLKVIIKATQAFVVFKTVMLAMKLKERHSEWAELGKGIKNADGSMREASESAKGFGQALKGIGITFIISLVFELGKAWLNAANKAQFYLDVQNAITKSVTKSGKDAETIISKRSKALQDEINKVNLLRSSQLKLAKTESERNKINAAADLQIKRANENNLKAAQIDLDSVTKAKNAALKELERAKKNQAIADEQFGSSGRGFSGVTGAGAATIKALDDLVVKYRAKVDGFTEQQRLLKEELNGVVQEVIELTIAEDDNIESTTESTKSVESKTKAYKDLSDQIDEILNRGQSLEEMQDEEIGMENDAIQEDLTEKLTMINDMERFRTITAEEASEQRLIAELESLLEQKRILESYGRDTLDIDFEISQARLNLAAETENDLVDLEKDANEEKIKARKELFDALEEIGNKELDRLIERSKRKQSILDDEIANNQALTDRLRDGANNQNAVATESLAKQEEITNQKIKEKQEEADKEARLEELKAAWSALNNFLDQGDSMSSASAKAISGVSVFKQLMQSVQGFYSGTKGKLGDESTAIRGGKDGHLIWADSNEMIFNPDQVKAAENAGLNTTDSILQTAILNKQLSGATMMANVTMQPSAQSDQSLLLEIRQLRKSIESKEEVSFHPLMRNGLAIGIREQHRKGGIIENYDTLTRS